MDMINDTTGDRAPGHCVGTDVTDRQIHALRNEASNAGDTLQVVICDIALGDTNWTDAGWLNDNATGFDRDELRRLESMTVESARQECVEVIRDAEVQR